MQTVTRRSIVKWARLAETNVKRSRSLCSLRHLIQEEAKQASLTVQKTANSKSYSDLKSLAVASALAAAGVLGAQANLEARQAYCEESSLQPLHCVHGDDSYQLGAPIGKGSFGTVVRATSLQKGISVAVKAFKRDAPREDFNREIKILKRISSLGGHDNIITFQEAFEDKNHCYVVTDYINGISLYDYLQTYQKCSEELTASIAKEIGQALHFLHGNGLVHNDIKPENMMIVRQQGKRRIKLIDFGCATVHKAEQAENDDLEFSSLTELISGTKVYWAPEIHESYQTTPASDMWAVGCLLYIMLGGYHPFDSVGFSSEEEIIENIKTGEISFEGPAWKNVGSDAKEVIKSLLERDPSKRLSAQELAEHNWIKQLVR